MSKLHEQSIKHKLYLLNLSNCKIQLKHYNKLTNKTFKVGDKVCINNKNFDKNGNQIPIYGEVTLIITHYYLNIKKALVILDNNVNNTYEYYCVELDKRYTRNNKLNDLGI